MRYIHRVHELYGSKNSLQGQWLLVRNCQKYITIIYRRNRRLRSIFQIFVVRRDGKHTHIGNKAYL